MDRQRIDKWLWHARVVRTRSAAAALAAAGHVRINGQRIDAPSHPVRPGDVVTVALDRAVRVLKVRAFADRRGSADDARAICESRSARWRPGRARTAAAGPAGAGHGPAHQARSPRHRARSPGRTRGDLLAELAASRHLLLAGGPCATSALSGEEMPVSRTESRLGRVPQISLRGLRRPDLVRAAGLRCAERALGRVRRVMK